MAQISIIIPALNEAGVTKALAEGVGKMFGGLSRGGGLGYGRADD